MHIRTDMAGACRTDCASWNAEIRDALKYPERHESNGIAERACGIAEATIKSLLKQVVVEGATMTWGVLLFRDPMLFWMIVVKYTTRNKFLAFGGLNSKIDDSMARKPIVLLLDYFFVTYTTLTIARNPRK